MNPRVEKGWLIVDCDLPDTARVAIAIEGPGMEFVSAFRDYDGDVRVAKIRVPAVRGKVRVLALVNGQTKVAGVIQI